MPAAAFPQLPGAENPYIKGHANLGGALDGLMSRLDSAAQQQQKLQQVQQSQPYQPYTETKGSDGLIQRSPNPAVQGMDPSRVRTFPISGKQVYMPTQDEQNAGRDKQQSFTDLKSALDDGARPAVQPNASVAPWAGATPAAGRVVGDDPSRVITPPGSKQSYYIPTDEEKATLRSAQAVKSKMALDALGQMPIPADVGDALGLKPGGQGTLLDIIRAHHEAFPDKPDASQSIIPGYTGAKGGPIARDPKTGATSEIALPAGSKREATPAQQDLAARFKERQQDRSDAQSAASEAKQQKARDDGQKQLDALQKQEQDQHALRIAYGQDPGDGKPFVDPQTKQTYTMNAGRRTYNKQQLDKATAAVGSLQDKQQKIQARFGGGQQAPAQPAGRAAAAAPAPASKFKIGDSVMHGDKPAKVVGFNPDGTAKIKYQ
jgi:hypothetical protein